MARAASALVWVLVAASLAGCGKGPQMALPGQGGPSGIADLAFEGETGTVRGTIIDAEGIPVPGALAGIDDISRVTADATGGFTFRNVPVGPHRLLAAALGYESAERDIDVVATEDVVADLQLERQVVQEPFHETVVKEGHVCLQLNLLGQTSDQGVIVNAGSAPCGGAAAGSIFQPFNVRVGLKTLVAEMEWAPTSGVTAPEFRLLIYQGGARSGVFTCDYCYGEARGTSPIALRIDEGVQIGEDRPFAGVDAENNTLEDVIYTPPSAANPAMLNVVLDQRTTIYNTLFYGVPAPQGFTALGA